jgi:hypothetical protein
MTLQLLHSEFPNIWRKFDFFYQCDYPYLRQWLQTFVGQTIMREPAFLGQFLKSLSSRLTEIHGIKVSPSHEISNLKNVNKIKWSLFCAEANLSSTASASTLTSDFHTRLDSLLREAYLTKCRIWIWLDFLCLSYCCTTVLASWPTNHGIHSSIL